MSEEINHGLLTILLLRRTVFHTVCNMGDSVLPTVQVLSEVRRPKWGAVQVDQETTRNKNTDVENDQKGIRDERWRVPLTKSWKGQLTESAGVVDVENYFSWC